MAGVPIKFRCYRCNQLLGVSRSKVGTVAACPKCKADLIVPDPAELESNANGVDVGSTPPTAADAPESNEDGVSLELLDIRPEDIRVEPGIAWTPASALPPREPYSPGAGVEPGAWSAPAAAETSSAEPEADAVTAGLVDLAGPPREAGAAEALVPPIQLNGPRLAESRPVAARSRDVVLPRSAVAAWSVFVLIAQGLAFVAGLLAGHFLWRVH